jgi:hypothetical protein
MLILLIFLSTPIRIEAGRELTNPWFSATKPAPQGTITKLIRERKEKPQKRPEKCGFFWRHVEIAAENAVPGRGASHSSGFRMWRTGAQHPDEIGTYAALPQGESAQRVARSA